MGSATVRTGALVRRVHWVVAPPRGVRRDLARGVVRHLPRLHRDPRVHPNYGGDWTCPAPFGEEMATRIALDHLSKMGYVPQRLAGKGQGRSGLD